MSKRIVAIDATLVAGTSTGDSTYWTGLLEGLAQTQSEFRFLLLSNREPGPDVPELDDRFEWKVLRSKGRWLSAVAMPRFAAASGACVFHTQYTLSPLARGGVTTIHDVSFFVEPNWFRPKDRFLLRRTVPPSARRAKRVITVSENSKADIVRFLCVGREKVAVTPLAAGRQFVPTDPTNTLKKYEIEEPYLFALGTRWPRKNIQLAVEACERLPKSVPHRLLVAGKEGWGVQESGKRTRYLGYVQAEDLPALYSGASLFLMPSLYEGFGLPVLEAMACGTPVVCSVGGSLSEVAGEAGRIVQSFDANDWANEIQTVLGDANIIESLRDKGLARAKQFDWVRTAEQTLEVYREAAE